MRQWVSVIAATFVFAIAQNASAGNCSGGEGGDGYKKAEMSTDSDDRY